jgi:hypothetical protein
MLVLILLSRLAPDTDEGKAVPQSHFSFSDPLFLKYVDNLAINVSLWPEIPRKRENGEWLYTSYNVDGAVL